MAALVASALGLAPCDLHPQRCVSLAGASPGSKPMPVIALGTWRGSYIPKDCAKNNYTCVRAEAQSAVESWVELGGAHIDGANDYRTQVEVAKGLQSKHVARESVYITTKCPGAIGFEATIQCAEDALQMLGQYGTNTSGYVDLLLIHFPFVIKPECVGLATSPACNPPNLPFTDPGTAARQETWQAMELLQKLGRARAIGISDYNATHIAETLAVATRPIALHQVEWNPLHHEETMLALCKHHGIQLQAWSPLGGARGDVLSNPKVQSIAAAHKVSAAQVVLKWSLQRGVAIVTGTANPRHMASDLDLWGFTLTDAEVTQIDGLQAAAAAAAEVHSAAPPHPRTPLQVPTHGPHSRTTKSQAAASPQTSLQPPPKPRRSRRACSCPISIWAVCTRTLRTTLRGCRLAALASTLPSCTATTCKLQWAMPSAHPVSRVTSCS